MVTAIRGGEKSPSHSSCLDKANPGVKTRVRPDFFYFREYICRPNNNPLTPLLLVVRGNADILPVVGQVTGPQRGFFIAGDFSTPRVGGFLCIVRSASRTRFRGTAALSASAANTPSVCAANVGGRPLAWSSASPVSMRRISPAGRLGQISGSSTPRVMRSSAPFDGKNSWRLSSWPMKLSRFTSSECFGLKRPFGVCLLGRQRRRPTLETMEANNKTRHKFEGVARQQREGATGALPFFYSCLEGQMLLHTCRECGRDVVLVPAPRAEIILGKVLISTDRKLAVHLKDAATLNVDLCPGSGRFIAAAVS